MPAFFSTDSAGDRWQPSSRLVPRLYSILSSSCCTQPTDSAAAIDAGHVGESSAPLRRARLLPRTSAFCSSHPSLDAASSNHSRRDAARPSRDAQMHPFLGSAHPGTATYPKPDVRAQYPTPVPEDLHVGSGLLGETSMPFQNSYCQATNMFSPCYNRELDLLGDCPMGTGCDAPLYNPRSPYSYAQPPHIPSYPSPSTASDTNLEDISTPSDTAFVSPAMDANNYPSRHHFASLESHSDFDACVDPAVISTAHSPQNDGRRRADDAPPAQVDGRLTLYGEDVGAGVIARHQSTVGNGSYMEDVVDARSPLSPALDLGRHMTYDLYAGSQPAAPQPLGTGMSPAGFLSPRNQGLVVIPRMSSQGPPKPNTGRRGRGFKSDGKKDKEAYPCLFQAAGCGQGFPGKNEWKRHVNTIHILWEAWVCAEGNCASLEIGWDQDMTLGLPSFPCKGRVFNRKDLYIMHLGRKHGHVPLRARADKKSSLPDQETVAARACHDRIRLPRDMSGMTCSVMGCNESFGGSSVWDSFLEHIADHLKKAVESSQGAVALEMGSWIDGSLTRFGVAAGFLFEDGGGGLNLRDPIWNHGQKGKTTAHGKRPR